MNRTWIILFLGLLVGAGAHGVYFQLQRPAGIEALDGQLAWIQTELGLSDAQFAQVKALHEESSPRLRALAAEVARMQEEFAAFENTRLTADRVDFIEFAQFVETRRNINRECLESTRRLVQATAGVMTPEQRTRYFGLVAAFETEHELKLN
ncbi:MAG TPA: Spy/CpxP family protein refolding chaperone [Opitutus sp.]|nr:Spy/CpxP family protein refolding chaperone [Opitutus sp.]